MLSQFKNKRQLLNFFSTEKVCIDYIVSQRWANEITCPYCEASNPYVTATRSRREELKGTNDYKCRSKECGRKFNALSNTIFENSKLDMKLWFEAIYAIMNTKKGISSLQLARDLGCTQKTAWFVLHRVREMVADKDPEMMGGEGVVVEVDETYLGGKVKTQSNKKRKAIKEKEVGFNDHKTGVMGYMERGGKLLMNVMLPELEIKDHLTGMVKTDSVLMTDSSKSYQNIGYNYAMHGVVDHSKSEFVKDDVIHTNSLENAFSILDRMIMGVYHYISPKHTQMYLHELCYRYNTRDLTDINRFDKVLKLVDGARLTYADLIRKAK